MAAMARAAETGGAAGIRANGAADIEAIAAALSQPHLPIIGIQKSHDAVGQLWITATFEEAVGVAQAGADIVAVDSRRPDRPDGTQLGALFSRVHQELGLPVMADVARFEEAARAQDLGADLVATTFAIQQRDTPDFELLDRLVRALSIPVVAEGRYWTPAQVCEAFDVGAHAVVVGTAITRPDDITRRFVDAIQAHFSAS
jgi:N-acylglucosamine-6-phosphate 2-epimerase